MRSFSDKVREGRLSMHLTQTELGALIGVSKRSVVSYETHGTRPRNAVLRKLADTLQVSVDYLLNDEIDDPLYGIEKKPYVDEARKRFGDRAAREMDFLLERNAALFAGGEISPEAKDAFFNAIMRAYLACKEEASRSEDGEKSS